MSTFPRDDLLNDNTACSMTHTCTQIDTIARDPAFCITTALLWVRTGTDSLQEDELRSIQTTEDKQSFSKDLGLLQLHHDRLLTAAEALGWRNLEPLQWNRSGVTSLQTSIDEHLSSLLPVPNGSRERRKMRVLINRNGGVKVESSIIGFESEAISMSPLMPPTLDLNMDGVEPIDSKPICRVYLDLEATRPSTFTTHKTTQRGVYDAARKRVRIEQYIPTQNEVLLYNPYGKIMEASASTVYFYRDGRWVTPAAICGANVGVTRRLALENGLCKQGTIELEEVKEGEYIWLSNAVRGFFVGKIEAGVSERPCVQVEDHSSSSQIL